MSSGAETAIKIKNKASELGFDACGITGITPLEEERNHLLSWLSDGNHADMHWMENHHEKRLNPGLLVPGSNSVIVVLHSYNHSREIPDPETPIISRYARGADYHKVMKKKLYELKQFVEEEIQPVKGRAFVDSAPLLERALAKRAGLGWIGKNSMLIHRDLGSYVFIGELVTNLDLPPDIPQRKEFCGTCTKCIDACPTKAIREPYLVDARKCISWWTIEYRGDQIIGPRPDDFKNRIFGCDICQEVCPWNRKAPLSREKAYIGDTQHSNMDLTAWEEMDEASFKKRFGHTPLVRAGLQNIRRNVRFVFGKK